MIGRRARSYIFDMLFLQGKTETSFCVFLRLCLVATRRSDELLGPYGKKQSDYVEDDYGIAKQMCNLAL